MASEKPLPVGKTIRPGAEGCVLVTDSVGGRHTDFACHIVSEATREDYVRYLEENQIEINWPTYLVINAEGWFFYNVSMD
jgi:hypothetical protein